MYLIQISGWWLWQVKLQNVRSSIILILLEVFCASKCCAMTLAWLISFSVQPFLWIYKEDHPRQYILFLFLFRLKRVDVWKKWHQLRGFFYSQLFLSRLLLAEGKVGNLRLGRWASFLSFFLDIFKPTTKILGGKASTEQFFFIFCKIVVGRRGGGGKVETWQVSQWPIWMKVNFAFWQHTTTYSNTHTLEKCW